MAVHRALSDVSPASAEFAQLQRQYFRTVEKYLDAGSGSCPLRSPTAARIVIAELEALGDWRVAVRHYAIMPNHWHAMIEPEESCGRSLAQIVRRVKGRSARLINAKLGRAGSVWQREWFDRWMRDDGEYARCVQYIRENPVRAALARGVGEHPWTR
jgi:putative transposase